VTEREEDFMKVEGLKPSLRDVNIEVKILGIGEPRPITSRKSQTVHSIAETLVGDETGCVVLNLWDDHIQQFNKGDVIRIKKGYTTLFKGFLRLNIGRHGTVEKIDKEIEEVNTSNNISRKIYETGRYI